MVKTKCSEVFKVQCKLLKGTGWWPLKDASLKYKLRGLFFFSCLVGLDIVMIIEAINDITDFAKLSEILYVMMAITTHITKQANIFIHHKKFLEMVDLLEDPIFSSYPDDLDFLMAKKAKLCGLVTNIYRVITLVCVFLMTISPILDNQPLPFPFPYDLGRYRFIMFIFQASAVCIGGWNHPLIDCLPGSLMGIAATQLEILSCKIMRSRNKDVNVDEEVKELSKELDEKIVKILKQCVQHHLMIIKYVEYINQVFSFVILIEFFGCVIIICNTLFHFVLVKIGSGQFFMLLSYVVFISAQLFMYCWFGHEVIWMSLRVQEACYTLNWYNCGNKVRKYLFIIMERSKRSLKVMVFKFSILSINSFTSVIQWSYSYFALLFKLYNKQSNIK